MEKKTIGKFIAVLRKANGMTQKELGDRLYVSDKTVSRWERDESTPELSLIPAIAEIFGVSTDELLRGERNNSAFSESGADRAKQQLKSDKQYKMLIDRRMMRFRNFCIISVGISLLGLFLAAIFNLEFSNGTLGFLISTFCSVVGIIFQICMAQSTKINFENLEEGREDQALQINNSIVRYSVGVIGVIIALLAFSLPLATETKFESLGLSIEAWLVYGTLFTGIVVALIHYVYVFFLRGFLEKRRLLQLSVREKNINQKKRFYLVKMTVIALCVSIVLGACMLALNILGAKIFAHGTVFSSYDDLQKYVNDVEKIEHDHKKITKTDYFIYEGNEYAVRWPIYPNYGDEKINEKSFAIKDDEGNILFGYSPNDAIFTIDFTFDSEGKPGLPATVYTVYEMDEAYFDIWQPIMSILSALVVINLLICAAIYLFGLRKIKNKTKG